MSLSDVISDTGGAAQVTLTRTVTGAYVTGRYTAGTATTSQIVIAAEPYTGRVLQDLPEGRRGDEVLQIYTDARLVPIRPGSALGGPGVDPDVLSYHGLDPDYLALMGSGEPWTVIRADHLVGIDGSHVEALACRAPSPQGVVP